MEIIEYVNIYYVLELAYSEQSGVSILEYVFDTG